MIAAEVCTENTACLLNTKIIPDFFSSFCDTHDKICLLPVFVVVMFVCFLQILKHISYAPRMTFSSCSAVELGEISLHRAACQQERLTMMMCG